MLLKKEEDGKRRFNLIPKKQFRVFPSELGRVWDQLWQEWSEPGKINRKVCRSKVMAVSEPDEINNKMCRSHVITVSKPG